MPSMLNWADESISQCTIIISTMLSKYQLARLEILSQHPKKPERETLPGALAKSSAFHRDVVGKADGFSLTSQIIFHPLLPLKMTRCHIYLGVDSCGPWHGIVMSTSECLCRDNHPITPLFHSSSVPLVRSLGSARLSVSHHQPGLEEAAEWNGVRRVSSQTRLQLTPLTPISPWAQIGFPERPFQKPLTVTEAWSFLFNRIPDRHCSGGSSCPSDLCCQRGPAVDLRKANDSVFKVV